MSISTAELGAKSALGPKREGPVVWLARMLGPERRLIFIFTFGSVAVKLVLCMVMALVLTSGIRFRSFWTGVLLIPWVAPTVVSALNFLWIFDYSLGVLNYTLVKVLHVLPHGVGWLSEPKTAMASVIGVNIWRGFPFFGISFLAGLRAIPAEMYEAAAVDGAGALQRFRHVT